MYIKANEVIKTQRLHLENIYTQIKVHLSTPVYTNSEYHFDHF
jgi:hypothetical protein